MDDRGCRRHGTGSVLACWVDHPHLCCGSGATLGSSNTTAVTRCSTTATAADASVQVVARNPPGFGGNSTKPGRSATAQNQLCTRTFLGGANNLLRQV